MSDTNFSYNNLNFWRKGYLVLMWLAIAAFSTITFFKLELSIAVTITTFFALFGAWRHWAITKRKITHLKLIAFVSFIPLFNLVGTLIFLSILRVSKKELENN
jgi:hypothetical protein